MEFNSVHLIGIINHGNDKGNKWGKNKEAIVTPWTAHAMIYNPCNHLTVSVLAFWLNVSLNSPPSKVKPTGTIAPYKITSFSRTKGREN